MKNLVAPLCIGLLLSHPGFAAEDVASNTTMQDITFHGFEIDQDLPPAERDRAELGLRQIFEAAPFRGSGVPLSVQPIIDQILAEQPAVEGVVDTSTRRGRYRVYGQLPSPPNRPTVQIGPNEVPMANLDESIFQYKGTYAAQSNCFTCHATVVDGQVVSGAMSTQIDQLSGYVRLAGLMQIEPILQGAIQQAIANGVPGAEADAEVFDSFTTHLADILLPIFQNSTARGTNLGPFTVWKTLARTIGPGLTAADRASGTALDYLFENTPFPTVDANPWWIYKYKDSIYRYADQSEHAGHFAFTFSQPRPDANIERPEQIEIMKNVLTYINQLESPAYKERISLYKAYYGKLLFHGDAKLHNGETLPCSQCHGTYTKKSNWLKVGGYEVDYNESGLRNVGTDGAYSEFLRSTGAEIVTERLSQIQDFFVDPALKPDIQVPSTLGYLPPILDGVWASAPYFHNGSVPTLYQVLNSKARAKIWKRSINPFAYNHNQVGLRHKSLTDEEYLGLALAAQGQHPFSPAALEFRQAYNTTDYGKGNGGHTAGDVMNHWERMAVIEFLKTLSGSNMEPSQ